MGGSKEWKGRPEGAVDGTSGGYLCSEQPSVQIASQHAATTARLGAGTAIAALFPMFHGEPAFGGNRLQSRTGVHVVRDSNLHRTRHRPGHAPWTVLRWHDR